MYTRSYNDEAEILRVPEGYSGTALQENIHTEPCVTAPLEDAPAKPNESVSAGLFGNLFSSPMLKGVLGGFLGNGTFGMPKIGTEEILIIATAAFLFFTSDGDRECAILLLLLLFIN